MRQRTRYQRGSVYLDKRSGHWFYRWREKTETGLRHRAEFIGTLKQIPTKTRAWRAADELRARANSKVEPLSPANITVQEVADRYIADEIPQRSKQMYLCNLYNHVLPKWGEREIASVLPSEVEMWLKGMSFAPKTKTHLRSMLRLLVDCAMRRGYISLARNPIELVRIKGATSRKQRRMVLSMDEFKQVLAGIPEEPFRTMVILAQCLGLRSCEVVGLKWCDVDWRELVINVRRSVREGQVYETPKTTKSAAPVPLDPAIAELLLSWKRKTDFHREEDWVFASPSSGGRLPYMARGVQQRHIRPAMDAQGLEAGMGWHTFRHTYRTLLSSTGAAVEVQRDLMRHASIVTTFDTYGDSLPEPMRVANSAVVKMVPR